MRKFLKHYKKLNFLTVLWLILGGIVGCASIQQPTGGKRDLEPPKVLKETPPNLSRNFSASKIQIEFDEYFKLSNEFKEISISPAMEKAPEFKVRKKVLEITFKDTLEKNTTYTINFGKGLVDYNEGNILKNYSYVFATGNVIDSLTISGTVTNAITNKPELEATVFILPLRQDSLFGKRKASIFTSTDSSGNFTLHNLREDTYKIYALKEQGGDRIYNSSNEGIAFRKEPIVLNKNVSNITLSLFNEEPPVFRVLERKLLSDGHLIFTFNKGLKKPGLTIINPAELNATKKLEFNKLADTALVWLPEISFDSILVAVQDSGKNLDTINIRRNKKDTYNTAVTISDNAPANKVRQGTDLILTLSSPITAADPTKITLLEDSIPKAFKFTQDTSSFRKYRVSYPWRNKRKYILDIGDNAFTGLMGGKNKSYSRTFTMDPDDNYTNLIVNVIPPDSGSYILQLVSKDIPVRSSALHGNKKIVFSGIAPGTYNLRVIYDQNNNGKWDTGNVKEQRQPEPIWNYAQEIILRVNLDDEETLRVPPLK
ncbi:MAG: hypothetical protein K0S09_946 [Sphingobacteriaceae bacterium]|jgi:uncharacterized protein (DUF2141 family)|nr:hypothetical protein [Sphingobacteriaceae bacterium]